MLEYKREWARISSKAEKVEKDWKDSHEKLSELEACWSTVSSRIASDLLLVKSVFLTLYAVLSRPFFFACPFAISCSAGERAAWSSRR